MLNIPEWQKVLIAIRKGKTSFKTFKGAYTKQLLYELEEQKFIKINKDNISLLDKGFKIVEGVVYGFFESL